jgi:DnaK suppressor protein
MDDRRARDLLAAERERLQREIARHMHEDDGEQSDPFFDPGNLAAKLYQDELDESLEDDLRVQLAALARAEQRLEAGTYGHSIESGEPIPDERLEALPTAELTIEEERAAERRGG